VKVIENVTIQKRAYDSYTCSIVTMALSRAVSEILNVEKYRGP